MKFPYVPRTKWDSNSGVGGTCSLWHADNWVWCYDQASQSNICLTLQQRISVIEHYFASVSLYGNYLKVPLCYSNASSLEDMKMQFHTWIIRLRWVVCNLVREVDPCIRLSCLFMLYFL